MTDQATDATKAAAVTYSRARRRLSKPQRRRRLVIGAIGAGLMVVGLAGVAWLGATASSIKAELEAATLLIPDLKTEISASNAHEAAATVAQLRVHTAAAKDAAGDPLWTLASTIPGLGANFSTVSEAARSADDVANLGLVPLVEVFGSLDWDTLLPSTTGTKLEPLEAASPRVSSAAHAVRISSERLDQIDTTGLLPQVAEPLTRARDELHDVTEVLDAAADAAQLAPSMLGAEAPRSYLLMIQNNAEARASGGIPGALAVLNFDQGKLTLGTQSSAGDIGVTSPPLLLEREQQQIYSGRLGKYMQDVNLTPDFPTAATLAQAMWEGKKGQQVDGVISIDPVALGYILDATGPVTITNPDLEALASTGLPTELNGKNVVATLLSDVYAKIQQPELQDAYFVGVAQEIFAALAGGKGSAKGLIEGITQAAEEGRVLVWSSVATEQSRLGKYPLSGTIAGPSISPAQFGVYFNDGTGAKMDYYVKRTVQLIKECPQNGYEQTTVRITSTNTAPTDAAISLPPYVTGDGVFGVPPGSVQTNITAYGPVQSTVETAKSDGHKTEFAPYVHSNRPVGIIAVRLAPGERKTVEFTFGKIVQHAEPNIVVTPTVQPVKDVTLPTVNASCG